MLYKFVKQQFLYPKKYGSEQKVMLSRNAVALDCNECFARIHHFISQVANN